MRALRTTGWIGAIFLCVVLTPVLEAQSPWTCSYTLDAVTRGAPTNRMALVFTADLFGEGGDAILDAFQSRKIRASFFLTGRFVENPRFASVLRRMGAEGHYVGPHSHRHLLLADWRYRRTIVSFAAFQADLERNAEVLREKGLLAADDPRWWIPPYEHYNAEIVEWSRRLGWRTFNNTPGTFAPTDWMPEGHRRYVNNHRILASVRRLYPNGGLNGFILLMHLGSGPGRRYKLHDHFPRLLDEILSAGYRPVTIPELVGECR